MATIVKQDKSIIVTDKKGKIKHHIPAKTTPTVGRVKSNKVNDKIDQGNDKSLAHNQEKYMNILINLGNESDFRRFANNRLSKSYAFKDAGLSDKDFTLEELREISADGRTQIFNNANLSDTHNFIKLVANRMLKNKLSELNENKAQKNSKTTLQAGLDWTREVNGYSEQVRYVGHHSVLLPRREELLEALTDSKKVVLKNMAYTFSPDTVNFTGDIVLSIGDENNLVVNYSQFNCACQAYSYEGSCQHSDSITIGIKQRLIGLNYSDKWERCGG